MFWKYWQLWGLLKKLLVRIKHGKWVVQKDRDVWWAVRVRWGRDMEEDGPFPSKRMAEGIAALNNDALDL